MMTMKPFMPLMTAGLLFLGACGLEKPPASLKFPDEKKEAAPADPKLAAGKATYDASCGACHESGMMGAPKPGDKAAWVPRIAQGLEVMTKKSIDGFQGKAGMMPAKGGNASLTNEQVTDAVAFMADKSK